MNYQIWCTYHDKKLIDEYNLKETKHFKLFYTKDILENNSLNYAQLYLNEFVTQYYVWKNQIKSDIVGFCHYRRNIIKNLYDKNFNEILNKNGFYLCKRAHLRFATNVVDEWKLGGLNNHVDLVKEYINIYYPQYDNILIQVYNDYNTYYGFSELYFAKWNIFNQLIKFVNDYIIFLFNKLLGIQNSELTQFTEQDYNSLAIKLDNINFELFKQEHIKRNTWDENNRPSFYGGTRAIGFCIEMLEGLFFNILLNSSTDDLNNKYYIKY